MTNSRPMTEAQQAVIGSTARKCLAIAPAGSGKTEVLIRRIERLLDESRGESFRVLAVTFTVKAAEELKERVARTVAEEVWRVDANTIHGFAFEWLRRAGQPVGVLPEVVVYNDDQDRVELLRRFFDSVGESHLCDDALRKVLRRIDALRTDLVGPSGGREEDIDGSAFQVAEAFQAYVVAMDEAGGIDFPGMLVKALELTEVEPDALGRVQRTYRHVLVDEGQDLTHAQAEMLRVIVGEALSLCVVADERQSIHGYAGGAMRWAYELLGSDFVQYELPHNFRCATEILSLAGRIALHFTPPRTDAEAPIGTPPGLVVTAACEDAEEEAKTVVDWIEDLLSKGIDASFLVSGEGRSVLPEEVAVLARTRYGLDDVQKELAERNLETSVQVDAGSLLATSDARLFHALLEVKANDRSRPAWRRVRDELFNLVPSMEDMVEPVDVATVVEVLADTPIEMLVASVDQNLETPGALDQLMEKVRVGGYFGSPDAENVIGWWKDYRASTSRTDRNLSGFLRYLLRVQQTRPYQPGVRLMTVHRAKGLEFKAVSIVGLTQGLFPDYRSLREASGVDAERRAFYVAVTRASRVLHLSWPRWRRTRFSERNDPPSQFLAEAGLRV